MDDDGTTTSKRASREQQFAPPDHFERPTPGLGSPLVVGQIVPDYQYIVVDKAVTGVFAILLWVWVALDTREWYIVLPAVVVVFTGLVVTIEASTNMRVWRDYLPGVVVSGWKRFNTITWFYVGQTTTVLTWLVVMSLRDFEVSQETAVVTAGFVITHGITPIAFYIACTYDSPTGDWTFKGAKRNVRYVVCTVHTAGTRIAQAVGVVLSYTALWLFLYFYQLERDGHTAISLTLRVALASVVATLAIELPLFFARMRQPLWGGILFAEAALAWTVWTPWVYVAATQLDILLLT